MHRPTTAEHVERNLRRHVYPRIGGCRLSTILPSDVQALVKAMLTTPTGRGENRPLSPATAEVIYRYVATVFKAAVADRRIGRSPCDGISVPKPAPRRVSPLATETVVAITDAIPERYRALVVLATGTGMRQGEVFGLTTDRVDFLRREVRVDRQLIALSGRAPEFGPPKTAASVRTIPLPQVVIDTLARHVATFLPDADGLLFTGSEGQRLRRSAFGTMRRETVASAGAPGVVFHELRHYYASLLIRHGESVKTVQARLGHASAAETLDTYSHLGPIPTTERGSLSTLCSDL